MVRQRARAGDLLLEPATGIGARALKLAWAGAQAKTVGSNDCVQGHIQENGREAGRLTEESG
jgi:hypothetical protein